MLSFCAHHFSSKGGSPLPVDCQRLLSATIGSACYNRVGVLQAVQCCHFTSHTSPVTHHQPLGNKVCATAKGFSSIW